MALTKSFHRLTGVYLSTVTKCFTNSLFKMVLYSKSYQSQDVISVNFRSIKVSYFLTDQPNTV